MNCVHGKSFMFDCPEGLAWSSATYRCEWPDESPDCDAEAFLGFKCPPNENQAFQPQPDRRFPHPVDCKKYFGCSAETNLPRLYSCGEDFAWNEAINGCDAIENVPTCK